MINKFPNIIFQQKLFLFRPQISRKFMGWCLWIWSLIYFIDMFHVISCNVWPCILIMRPKQNVCFVNAFSWIEIIISILIWQKFSPEGPFRNMSSLVQVTGAMPCITGRNFDQGLGCNEMTWKFLSGNWWPFCLSLNELTHWGLVTCIWRDLG